MKSVPFHIPYIQIKVNTGVVSSGWIQILRMGPMEETLAGATKGPAGLRIIRKKTD